MSGHIKTIKQFFLCDYPSIVLDYHKVLNLLVIISANSLIQLNEDVRYEASHFQLFSIVHAGLYAVPCAVIYDSVQTNGIRPDRGFDVQPAHPFHDTPYQDL